MVYMDIISLKCHGNILMVYKDMIMSTIPWDSFYGVYGYNHVYNTVGLFMVYTDIIVSKKFVTFKFPIGGRLQPDS